MDMKNYLGHGDIIFSILLAYFLTWSNALRLNTFGMHEVLFLLWNIVFNFVVIVALLWIVSRFTKKPLFGQKRAYYYPTRIMLRISLVVVAVLALFNYLTGDHQLTTQRILTYIIGYLLGNAVFMVSFYFLIIKKK